MNDKIISLSDPVGFDTLQVIAKADRFNHWMYAQFKSELNGDILEAGSGIGNISQLVVDDGLSLTLSDFNKEYCSWLKKKFEGVRNVKEVITIDLAHPHFKTEYSGLKERFDSIFLLNVIEHLANDREAIANCDFILKPGGRLIALVPAYSWLYCKLDKELGHYRRYTSKTMRQVLATENFTIKKIVHFNFLGMCGWFLSGKLFGEGKLGGGEMNFFDHLVPMAKILDKITFNKIGLSIIGTAVKKK